MCIATTARHGRHSHLVTFRPRQTPVRFWAFYRHQPSHEAETIPEGQHDEEPHHRAYYNCATDLLVSIPRSQCFAVRFAGHIYDPSYFLFPGLLPTRRLEALQASQFCCFFFPPDSCSFGYNGWRSERLVTLFSTFYSPWILRMVVWWRVHHRRFEGRG